MSSEVEEKESSVPAGRSASDTSRKDIMLWEDEYLEAVQEGGFQVVYIDPTSCTELGFKNWTDDWGNTGLDGLVTESLKGEDGSEFPFLFQIRPADLLEDIPNLTVETKVEEGPAAEIIAVNTSSSDEDSERDEESSERVDGELLSYAETSVYSGSGKTKVLSPLGRFMVLCMFQRFCNNARRWSQEAVLAMMMGDLQPNTSVYRAAHSSLFDKNVLRLVHGFLDREDTMWEKHFRRYVLAAVCPDMIVRTDMYSMEQPRISAELCRFGKCDLPLSDGRKRERFLCFSYHYNDLSEDAKRFILDHYCFSSKEFLDFYNDNVNRLRAIMSDMKAFGFIGWNLEEKVVAVVRGAPKVWEESEDIFAAYQEFDASNTEDSASTQLHPHWPVFQTGKYREFDVGEADSSTDSDSIASY